MRKTISLILLGLLCSVGMAWGDTAYGFENNKISESGYPTSAGDGSRSISSSVSRTGTYSLEQNNNNTSDKVVRVEGLAATFKGNTHYVHAIAYLKKTVANAVTVKNVSFYAGSEFASTSMSQSLTTDWTRITNKGQRTGNSQEYTSVQLRLKTNTATSGDKVYIDDIVVYVTENNVPTDLTRPSSATGASATTTSISWTNGSDTGEGATGIQNTLIWKRTSGSGTDLTLNDQGIYSLTSTEGPSTDQSGHWTLISASVAANATSYAGSFSTGECFAIVHRDLAYNYSAPIYASVPATSAYTVTFDANINGTCATESLTEASAGAGVTLPSVTPNSGYVFNGWYDDDSDGDKVGDAGDTYHPTSNITVYAQYSNLYTVTYALNGGTGTTPTQDAVTAGTEITLHNGTTGITAPESKVFAGWLCSVDEEVKGGGASYTMTAANTTFTAQWKTPNDATFTNGSYVVGSSALDLGSLFSSSSTGTVTYTVKNANGTSAAIDGTSFTATAAGTATVTATQAATSTYTGCEIDATITVTYPATGSATITYVLDVTNGGTTLQTITGTEATSSSISVSTSTDLLAGGLTKSSSKGTHNGTRTLGINTLAEETADKYFYVTFTVADGYEITPSEISLKVLTIGGNATSYKAVLTDGNSSITGTVDATNDSEKTLAGWSGLGTTTLSGTVTLKLYAWYTTSGSYNAYRLSTPITISGTVAVASVKHTVTYALGTGATGTIPTEADKKAGATFTLHNGTTGITAPSGKVFNGWNDGTSTYAGGATYTMPDNDVTLTAQWATAYTVTYALGTGASGTTPTETAKAEGATFTLHNGKTDITAPTGKVFAGWNDGTSTYAGGAEYTMPNKNVTLTAQWEVPASGILFSWTSKTGISNTDISAGTYNFTNASPGSWLATLSGGTVVMEVPSDGNMRIRGSQLAFNSSSSYFKVTLSYSLALGDMIEINSSGNTNNLWLTVGNKRPDAASGADAVIGQGTAYTIGAGNNLIGESTFYIWRAGSTTQVGTVTISRPATVTITSAGWATYCSPSALDLEHATNLTDAYIVIGAEGEDLDVTSVKGGTVPANTGLLLKAPAGTVTIPVVASSSTNVSDNELVGVTLATMIEANSGYVLMGSPSLGFYKNANAFTLGAHTAYLPVGFDSGSGAPSMFRLVEEENNATNIENIETNEKAVKFFENGQLYILRDGVVYDALGRKIR